MKRNLIDKVLGRIHYLFDYLLFFIRSFLLKKPEKYKFGSTKWLESVEKLYGGRTINIARRKVSKYDPRSSIILKTGGMIGGDKMLFNKYSKIYSKYLSQFEYDDDLVIVEFGILKGVGLAVFSSLFPNSTIFGLDIDLSYFKDNIDTLKNLGAFKNNKLYLHNIDQFSVEEEDINKILGGRKIDILIDDGLHSLETISNTAKAVKPFLNNEKHCLFFEDNPFSGPIINKLLGDISDVKMYKNLCVANSKFINNS